MRKTTLVLAMTLVGCVAPQRPYRFTAQRPPSTLTAETARTLAGMGLTPALVDEHLGLIQTAWQDTGFLYGYVDDVAASIVRRYTVTLEPYPSGALVLVRADEKRCQRGGYTVGEVEVRGACEAMDGIPEEHQNEVDQLGQELQAKLNRQPVPVPPAAPPAL